MNANAPWLPSVPKVGLPASLSLRCSLFCQRTWHLILRDTQMSVFVRMHCIAEHPPFSDRGCAIIKMKSRTEYNTGLGWVSFFLSWRFCFTIKIKSRAGYCTELSANLGRVSVFHGDLFFYLCVHNGVFMLLLPAVVFFLRHFGFGFLFETVSLGETSHAFDGFPDSLCHFLNRLAFVIGENVAFLGCG